MAVTKSLFGKSPDGRDITLYTITGNSGMKMAVTDLGAALVSLWVPDADGRLEDVVLGFDRGEDYCGNPNFFGAIIGPNANRVAGAAYTLDGVSYRLDANDGPNNLHSHSEQGYHKRLWEAQERGEGVLFSLTDDNTMGFPGKKQIQVTYTLREDNAVEIRYHGASDRRTLFNLTNHSYFNLDGAGSGTVEDHELWLGACSYTPVAAGGVPTGEIASVEGTPMDFRQMKRIGVEIDADFEQLRLTAGYDHNFVTDGWDGALRHIATVRSPKSGRVLKVSTTLPGVQFYAGNFIDRQTGKQGRIYDRRFGLCLETQHYPDAVHHGNFPSCIAEDYDAVTVYSFA